MMFSAPFAADLRFDTHTGEVLTLKTRVCAQMSKEQTCTNKESEDSLGRTSKAQRSPGDANAGGFIQAPRKQPPEATSDKQQPHLLLSRTIAGLKLLCFCAGGQDPHLGTHSGFQQKWPVFLKVALPVQPGLNTHLVPGLHLSQAANSRAPSVKSPAGCEEVPCTHLRSACVLGGRGSGVGGWGERQNM